MFIVRIFSIHNNRKTKNSLFSKNISPVTANGAEPSTLKFMVNRPLDWITMESEPPSGIMSTRLAWLLGYEGEKKAECL